MSYFTPSLNFKDVEVAMKRKITDLLITKRIIILKNTITNKDIMKII